MNTVNKSTDPIERGTISLPAKQLLASQEECYFVSFVLINMQTNEVLELLRPV
jgi:hypothetical protein